MFFTLILLKNVLKKHKYYDKRKDNKTSEFDKVFFDRKKKKNS